MVGYHEGMGCWRPKPWLNALEAGWIQSWHKGRGTRLQVRRQILMELSHVHTLRALVVHESGHQGSRV